MASAAQPTFELRGAVVALGGRTVLRDLELVVAPGEAVALVGPSGAGKTTLLRLLNATLAPDAGQVRFEGRPIGAGGARGLQAVRARVGFVHQDLALIGVLRVVQNVVSGKLGQRGLWSNARAMLWPSRADLLRAHTLLERVGIGDRLYQRTDTLSGGQQQRVAVARALFQDPHALLADEPVASVDPARARDLVRLLTELAAEQGLTLIASLHDQSLAREFFPRIVGLRRGAVAFDSPAAALSDDDFRELYRLEDAELAE